MLVDLGSLGENLSYSSGEVTRNEFWVVHQFEITPKALANSSPGLERSDNPGFVFPYELKPCKGSPTAEPFSGFSMYLILDTQGCRLRSNPGLELANASGVFQTDALLNFGSCSRTHPADTP